MIQRSIGGSTGYYLLTSENGSIIWNSDRFGRYIVDSPKKNWCTVEHPTPNQAGAALVGASSVIFLFVCFCYNVL